MGILADLCNKYKVKGWTDKDGKTHTFPATGKSYLDIYEEYFQESYKKIRNVLELGVLYGSSLRMWRDFFPNAQIFGLDINSDFAFEEDRIKVFTGSQHDPNILNKVIKASNNRFDIVIDDASHINRLTLMSFAELFKYVVPGGWYAIEDLEASYMTFHGDNKRQDMDTFFLSMLSKMDTLKGDIETIQFWPGIVFIKKARKKIKSHM